MTSFHVATSLCIAFCLLGVNSRGTEMFIAYSDTALGAAAHEAPSSLLFTLLLTCVTFAIFASHYVLCLFFYEHEFV